MSDDAEDPESRSERLRRRRSECQRDKADASDETDKADTLSETDSPSQSSQPSNPAKSSKPAKPSVKDEQTPVYMYLPETQKREIKRLYNVLKADYEYEYDEPFEKNRHFYPLLIQHGLEGLEEMDADELQDRLISLS